MKELMDRILLLERRLDEVLRRNVSLEAENALLRADNAALRIKVAELEARLKKNSNTSSKPPSSDGYQKRPPKTKSLRGKSGKKPGGQPGHTGANLRKSDTPTNIILHIACDCVHCGGSLEGGKVINGERRQVFDIPPPPPVNVEEHIVQMTECPFCLKMTSGVFPEGVNATVQYGPRIKALTVDIVHGNMVSVKRCAALVESITGMHLSTGTVVKFLFECADGLEPWRNSVLGMIIRSAIAHFDETGIRCLGKLHWLHSASTAFLTLQHVHRRRGKEGSDAGGILPLFEGNASHDCWGAYFRYLSCQHNPCRVHFLRELENLIENWKGQSWAKAMKTLLLEMRDSHDEARRKGKKMVAPVDIVIFGRRYDKILDLAFNENPDMPVGKACKDAFNLALRLKKLQAETISFLWDVSLPFGNNQAEQDVRMVKVKSKVSGCFRSFEGASAFATVRSYISTATKNGFEGASAFATVRSYISTATKNGIDTFHALVCSFEGRPFLPQMQV